MFCFICHLAVPLSTLGYYREDSSTNPIFNFVFYSFFLTKKLRLASWGRVLKPGWVLSGVWMNTLKAVLQEFNPRVLCIERRVGRKRDVNLLYKTISTMLIWNCYPRSVTRSYYRGAAGALLVYDISRWVKFCFYFQNVRDKLIYAHCNSKSIMKNELVRHPVIINERLNNERLKDSFLPIKICKSLHFKNVISGEAYGKIFNW